MAATPVALEDGSRFGSRAEAVAGLRARGWNSAAIAAELRLTPAQVHRIELDAGRTAAARATRRRRPCLGCARPILSEGPHHRLCDSCRQRADWP